MGSLLNKYTLIYLAVICILISGVLMYFFLKGQLGMIDPDISLGIIICMACGALLLGGRFIMLQKK